MRGPQDVIEVRVQTTRRLQLDRERLEQDPVWHQIWDKDTEGVMSDYDAVRLYVSHYLIRDQFPDETPATNGPGDIDQFEIGVNIPCPQQQQQQQQPNPNQQP